MPSPKAEFVEGAGTIFSTDATISDGADPLLQSPWQSRAVRRLGDHSAVAGKSANEKPKPDAKHLKEKQCCARPESNSRPSAL
jgi:hypothetical protein